MKSLTIKANESQILDKDFDIASLMSEIKKMSEDLGQKILTDKEVELLSIKRGTLSPDERREIEKPHRRSASCCCARNNCRSLIEQSILTYRNAGTNRHFALHPGRYSGVGCGA